MRRVLLLLVVLSLFCAIEVFAHCQRCSFDAQGCASCVSTDYNAWILCTVVLNGAACSLQGTCEGPMGDPCAPPRPCEPEARLERRAPQLRGEWQLVSVEVTRAKDVRPRRRS